MNFTPVTDSPGQVLGYGFVPEGKRGIIHSTPAGDRLIKARATQGPARMGRKKEK